MSIRWMSEIWDHGPSESRRRFVLIALADNADDNGECFPSIAMLARKCCLEERMIQYHLKALEADGFLKIERGGKGRGSRSRYKLQRVWVQPAAPLESKRVQPTAPLLKDKRVQPTAPLQRDLGCNPSSLRVQSMVSPLMSLTTKEPSGVKNPPTPTAVPTDANGGVQGEAVTNSAPPSPGKVIPMDPLGNPEVYAMATLVALASPEARFYEWTEPEITYSHRKAVVTAAKQTADFLGISLGEALQGLLEGVQAQVGRMDLSRLQYLSDFKKIEVYFAKHAYRTDPKNLTGGNNGKSKSERIVDNVRTAAARLEARFGSGGQDEFAAQRQRLTRGN